MLLAFSVQRPTLCIFEDAHWLDASTLELLELMISRIAHARVLLIVSSRPEFRPTWLAHANVSTHSLTRLSQAEVRTMIRDLLRGGSMPQKLVDQIIEKADGVPLFIEELTSSTLSAPLRGDSRAHRTTSIAQGSGDVKRRVNGAARPRCAQPQSCADRGCDWTRVLRRSLVGCSAN